MYYLREKRLCNHKTGNKELKRYRSRLRKETLFEDKIYLTTYTHTEIEINAQMTGLSNLLDATIYSTDVLTIYVLSAKLVSRQNRHTVANHS